VRPLPFPRAILLSLPALILVAAFPAASPAQAAPTIQREAFHRPAHAQPGAPVLLMVGNLANPVRVFFTKASGGTVEAATVSADIARGLVLARVPATAGTGDMVVRANGIDSPGFYFRVDFSPFVQGTDAVSGTVKNGSGNGVSGALAALFEDACGEFVLRDFTTTDSGGHYTLHSRAGSGTVFVLPAGGALAGASSAVTLSSTPATADLTLDAGTLVTGSVVDATNQAAISGARISFDSQGGFNHEEAISDAGGAFSARLAGGVWNVVATPPAGDTTHASLTTQTFVFGSSQPLSALELPRGVRITGTFTRAFDGTPMAGVDVAAETTQPCCGEADRKPTAGDGTFTLIVPANSVSDLLADLDPEIALLGAFVQDVPVVASDVVQDLTSQDAATISGTLADKTSKGLRDVTVLATHASGLFETAAISCPDGTYELHLPPDPNGFLIQTGPPNPRTGGATFAFKSWTTAPGGTFFPCEADPLPVPSASTTMSGIDFILALAAKVQGKISTSTGSCSDDFGPFGLTIDDGTDHACSLGQIDPNSIFSGGFTLIGLPSTSDLPSLRACTTLPGFDAQCFDMKTPPAFDPIVIPPGGTKTGVNLCVQECTPKTWFLDADGDGAGDPADTQMECTQPIGYVATGDDCDDTDPAIHPGATEVCNNKDDDCNGTIDNFTSHCGAGACAATGTCLAGVDSCMAGAPSPEVCNGLDDDCNGQVDDGNPGGGTPCTTGQLGVCAPGTQTCAGGSIQCIRNTNPSAEICDALDNNCDGTVDAFPTSCGTGACASTGTCTGGVDSCMALAPQPEACNGVDDDCNGQVDEGNPGGGAPCATGQAGICAAGSQVCSSGSLQCVRSLNPSAEICDNLDNDCDGTVDGFATSCGSGICAAAGSCVAGVDSCIEGAPGTEVCDGVDDDCNGQVDEVAGGCTLFVTDPLPAGTLDCTSPTTFQPTISWNRDRYTKFKVFLSTSPTFPSTARVTSGKSPLTTTSWHVKAKAWKSICKKAIDGGPLFIKVQGTDNLAPKTDPLKKFFSPAAEATVVK